jgi:hypothetical protein
MCDWRNETFVFITDSKGVNWARKAVDGSKTSTEDPKGSESDPIPVPSADDEFEEFIAGDGTKEPSEQRERLDEENQRRRESSSESGSDTDSVEGAVRMGLRTRAEFDASGASDAEAGSKSSSGTEEVSDGSDGEVKEKPNTAPSKPATPRLRRSSQ